MYIIVGFVSKNVFKSKDHVRNNVRKWPNLCSIKPEKYFEKLVGKFRLVRWRSEIFFEVRR